MGVKVTNNAFGTLSAAINTTATTITLDSGQGARFPTLGASDYFFGTLVDTSNNLEIVKVTARSTDSLTVVRGQDGTTATAFAIGDRFELRPVAALFDDIIDNASVDGINSSANATAMTINSSEQVGIKTTSPDVLLDVGDSDHGSAGNTGIQIQSSQDFSTTYAGNNTNTWPGVQIANNDATSNRTAAGVTFVHRSSSSGIAGVQSTSAAADRADLRFITRGSGGIAEAMVITEAGYITTPKQPSFTAHRNVDQDITQSSTNVGLVFDSVDHNIGSHYSTSTGRFTCPVDGIYFLSFSIRLDFLGGSYAWCYPFVNGSPRYDTGGPNFITQDTGSYTTLAAAGQLDLNANDYVQMYAYVAGDSDWDFENASQFSMRLMG